MQTKIFLEKYRSKKSVNTSKGLDVSLTGKRKLLPTEDIYEKVSAYEQYTKERAASTKIRLTLQVDTVCSNVLFNKVTEVVKNEGSSGVSIVNYGFGEQTIPNIIGKGNTMAQWSGSAESVRDTQLSKTDVGYVYHCGENIFNNHILRNNAFRAVCQPTPGSQSSKSFNTINDMMRNGDGGQIDDKVTYPISSGKGEAIINRHLYKYDDIYSFKDCVENRLVKQHNGWYGFYNKSNIKTYSGTTGPSAEGNNEMGIEKVLAYENGGDYVDMYPGRDLYSFVPKYNKFRNRAEKNWNYCLTYPSSSTTEGFEDIIETTDGLNSLKVLYFDENTYDDSGNPLLVIFSKTKHGLKVGDYVNIYSTFEGANTLLIENANVTIVQDDYNFAVFPQATKLSNNWVDVSEKNGGEIFRYNFARYMIDPTKTYCTKTIDPSKKYYILYGERVNLDEGSTNLSYKKVVNGAECDYYVRIFSRLPNFRFANGVVQNEYDLYGSGSTMIHDNQSPMSDFENHLSRLAFAKNIYSDNIAQIVYTDDIDLSYIKDNLGRPLTSLYLTVVKNNKGHEDWYSQTASGITGETMEFSHCFGSVTCALDLSEEALFEDTPSIKTINNIEGPDGLQCSLINKDTKTDNDTNTDIYFDRHINYYGDLACYDYYNAIEEVVQPVLHRFNTAQRELNNSNSPFGSYIYDEIWRDDFDDNFTPTSYTKSNTCSFKEGYYYQPHYEIPVRSFGNVNTVMPDLLTIRSIEYFNDNRTLYITTLERNFLTEGDKAVIYDTNTKKEYRCVARATFTNGYVTFKTKDRTFICDVFDENGEEAAFPRQSDLKQVKLFKIDNLDIPSYAHLMKDGTCRYIWRNVYQNGMNPDITEAEEYPFTNGALYLNKFIRIYVRRQDPQGLYGLYSSEDILDEGTDVITEDNYYEPEEIRC